MAAVTVKFRRAHLAQSGSRRRRSGRELRRRYSDMLLNNALIAGLLANGSYAAFEAQTKLRVRGDREASFVMFSLLCIFAEIAAVIFSLYLYNAMWRAREGVVPSFLKHHAVLLRAPRWLINVGLMAYGLTMFLQTWIHYGSFAIRLVWGLYGACVGAYVVLVVWMRAQWHGFKHEARDVWKNHASHWRLFRSSGLALKSRSLKRCLILGDLGALLMRFAYEGLQSQLEVIYREASETAQDETVEVIADTEADDPTDPTQRAFLLFSMVSAACYGLAVFWCMSLWNQCNKATPSATKILIKHFRILLNVPVFLLCCGMCSFLTALAIQGHLDYGEYTDQEFATVYCAAGVLLLAAYIWYKRQDTFAREKAESCVEANIAPAPSRETEVAALVAAAREEDHWERESTADALQQPVPGARRLSYAP